MSFQNSHKEEYDKSEGKNKEQQKPSSFFGKIPTTVNKKKALLKMLVGCNLPLSLVEKEDFKEFVELLDKDFGQKIPARRTVSRSLLDNLKAVEEELKEILEHTDDIATSLDLWSSKALESYMGVLVHYITEDWEYKSRVIDFLRCKGRHTGLAILEAYRHVLQFYNIESKEWKSITDSASNMIKAFEIKFEMSLSENKPVSDDEEDSEDDDDKGEDIQEKASCNDINELECEDLNLDELFECEESNRDPCGCHNIQLVVGDGFKAAAQGPVHTSVAKCGKLVCYVRKSLRAAELLKEETGLVLIKKNDTRWNSEVKMIRRVRKVYSPHVESILDKMGQSALKLRPTQLKILEELVDLLEPFEHATDQLQQDKGAGMAQVIPNINVLKLHLDSFETVHLTAMVNAMKVSIHSFLRSLSNVDL